MKSQASVQVSFALLQEQELVLHHLLCLKRVNSTTAFRTASSIILSYSNIVDTILESKPISIYDSDSLHVEREEKVLQTLVVTCIQIDSFVSTSYV